MKDECTRLVFEVWISRTQMTEDAQRLLVLKQGIQPTTLPKRSIAFLLHVLGSSQSVVELETSRRLDIIVMIEN